MGDPLSGETLSLHLRASSLKGPLVPTQHLSLRFLQAVFGFLSRACSSYLRVKVYAIVIYGML